MEGVWKVRKKVGKKGRREGEGEKFLRGPPSCRRAKTDLYALL